MTASPAPSRRHCAPSATPTRSGRGTLASTTISTRPVPCPSAGRRRRGRAGHRAAGAGDRRADRSRRSAVIRAECPAGHGSCECSARNSRPRPRGTLAPSCAERSRRHSTGCSVVPCRNRRRGWPTAVVGRGTRLAPTPSACLPIALPRRAARQRCGLRSARWWLARVTGRRAGRVGTLAARRPRVRVRTPAYRKRRRLGINRYSETSGIYPREMPDGEWLA